MEKLEDTILRNLLFDEDYTRKTLPFFRDEYFTTFSDRLIFEEIRKYFDKYSKQPSIEALGIELNGRNDIAEEQLKSAMESLETIEKDYKDETVTTDMNWLMEKSEKFCQDKALYNAIINSIAIFDENKTTKETKDAIPSILADALGVSFDVHIGHDYIDNADERFQFYRKKEEKIPFDLDFFNKITKGGLPPKTLNVCLAGTGVGKSLFMCHVASSALLQNKNVLYISLEMAEKRIAERIDANLMNISLEDLHDLPRRMFDSRMEKLQKKTEGKLIIKEYPTASAHCGHFRALYNELLLKKQFRPDIIFIDYINICASSRFKYGSNVNSYTYIKGIAEEMRGLAVELNVPIVSATQTTRQGFVSTDIGLEDTSESFGLPATADLMFALISTEELEDLNQMLVKQLKNRYNDPTANKRFIIGVDRAKMRLYDVSQKAQTDLVDTGQDDEEESSSTMEERFADFKV